MKPVNSFVISLFAIMSCAQIANAQDVTIKYGKIEGNKQDNSIKYLGIPYASAPIGEKRWTEPTAPQNWSGTLKADKYGASCVQSLSATLKATSREEPMGKESEDCLFANVFVPKNGGKNLPVMVWIHGGANRIGSSSNPIYDGDKFARDGVILVSFNYRLGLFGYFDHKAFATDNNYNGNFGTLDQIAALKWVNENIEAFGGDKSNVTIFGESAGGGAVLNLMTLPQAQGLFQKAIVESGGGWQKFKTREEFSTEITSKMETMGIAANSSIADLKAIPADKLSQFDSGMGFGPYIDNKLVKTDVATAFANSQSTKVPLIIGSNSNESSLMDRFGLKPTAIFANPQSKKLADMLYDGQNLDDTQKARKFFTDSVFAAPAYTIARDHSVNNKTYFYNFSYLAQIMRGRADGVGHGGEIPYVFETFSSIGRIAPFLTPRDNEQQAIVHTMWVNFAKSGTPSANSIEWKELKKDAPSMMSFDDNNQNQPIANATKYEAIEKALKTQN